jgi:hypothetical protein
MSKRAAYSSRRRRRPPLLALLSTAAKLIRTAKQIPAPREIAAPLYNAELYLLIGIEAEKTRTRPRRHQARD